MINWISCKKTPPPIGQQVLAYGEGLGELVGGENMDICVWDGNNWWDEGGTEISWGIIRWTHWMPLPPSPTKEYKQTISECVEMLNSGQSIRNEISKM